MYMMRSLAQYLGFTINYIIKSHNFEVPLIMPISKSRPIHRTYSDNSLFKLPDVIIQQLLFLYSEVFIFLLYLVLWQHDTSWDMHNIWEDVSLKSNNKQN